MRLYLILDFHNAPYYYQVDLAMRKQQNIDSHSLGPSPLQLEKHIPPTNQQDEQPRQHEKNVKKCQHARIVVHWNPDPFLRSWLKHVINL
jgi:hypothetical protein